MVTGTVTCGRSPAGRAGRPVPSRAGGRADWHCRAPHAGTLCRGRTPWRRGCQAARAAGSWRTLLGPGADRQVGFVRHQRLAIELVQIRVGGLGGEHHIQPGHGVDRRQLRGTQQAQRAWSGVRGLRPRGGKGGRRLPCAAARRRLPARPSGRAAS
jgi:hypothetical protein